jgi:hypothetical protein
VVTRPATRVFPPLSSRRRGLRILTMDGGGVRGLMEIEMLREIERLTGKRVCCLAGAQRVYTRRGNMCAFVLVRRRSTSCSTSCVARLPAVTWR